MEKNLNNRDSVDPIRRADKGRRGLAVFRVLCLGTRFIRQY